MAATFSQRIVPSALALALGGVGSSGFAVSELYGKNYEDPMVGLWCVGLTASGFEQGAGVQAQFSEPDQEDIEHFHGQGANCFRVPITWNRLQSSLGSNELDPVSEFVETIRYITEDLEDYAIVVPFSGSANGGLRYEDQEATMDDFVNLWTAISKEFAQNDRVIFELFDYPEYGCHNGDCGDGNTGFFGWGDDTNGEYVQAWLEWCQGAVDAIRAQGADNYVLVPGLKKSLARDWLGAQWWGESLDGYSRAGNLRLFALQDPSNRTAYSMRQYFDLEQIGLSPGCEGHDAHVNGGLSADEALTYTIEIAQKYNKKLWMTEVLSIPDADATTAEREECESKLGDYLAEMADSGVFLGYQVWQFGCKDCAKGVDLSPESIDENYNFDWYNLEKYGITSTSTSRTQTTVTRTSVTSTTATTSTCTGCTHTQTSTTGTTITATTATSTTTPEDLNGAPSALPSAGLAAAVVLAQLLAC